MEVNDIPVIQVDQFSERDKAYYTDTALFEEFISYDFDYDEFPKVISAKSKHSINRLLLTEVISEQYASTTSSTKTAANIAALAKDNCFTVITAHQPSLLTGPLYYIYKILSAVKLAERLNESFDQHHIVPCFILGSEDHDFEEINHLHLYGQKIEWVSKGKGSVGAYSTDGLNEAITEVLNSLGPDSKAREILLQLRTKLPTFSSYDEFAFQLTHILFDHLGLVIIRMSDKRLKEAFIPIIKEEVLNSVSKDLVVKTQNRIKEKLGFNPQAHAREINFFYCQNQTRDRIEYVDNRFKILETDLSFSKEEMTKEIEAHPERFSPNVVMRPLYQEHIFPNLAYIGGGGELAYWTERKSQFQHFGIPFPMLIRRKSGLILTPTNQKQLDKIGLSLADTFQGEQALINKLIANSDHPDYQLQDLKSKIDELYEQISTRVAAIDKTLVNTAASEKTKMKKSLDYIEGKLKKALKQKEEVNLKRLTKLKVALFPKGLQERHDNIFEYLSDYGPELIDEIYEQCDPFEKNLKVFTMPPPAG